MGLEQAPAVWPHFLPLRHVARDGGTPCMPKNV